MVSATLTASSGCVNEPVLVVILVSSCSWAPGLVVNPTTIVVEHGRGRADASSVVNTLAHAVLDSIDLLASYGCWILGSRLLAVCEGFCDEGHIIVQHVQFC